MSYETNDKMVSHPDHYKSGKYEVIDIIDEFTKDLSGTEAVCTANAIKYILRWKKKNGVQDLKKAVWYLMHMIDRFADEEREDHAKFDEWRLAEPQGGYTVMQDTISKDIEEQKKHRASGTVSIDDEPEPHVPQQASTGVYIPEEPNAAFMNLPYDELLKQCREYFIANGHLREQFEDACDNIKLLEEELKQCRVAASVYDPEERSCDTCNYAYYMDRKRGTFLCSKDRTAHALRKACDNWEEKK